jgi:hypothetical protein
MGRQTLNLSFILRADEKEFKGFGYFINWVDINAINVAETAANSSNNY